MDTKMYLRIQFNNKIRPLFIKEECECCGETENLELHHDDKHFATLLNESLALLNLDLKNDTEEYSDVELESLSLIMLGKQVKINYLTVCDDCHNEIHVETGKDLRNFYRYYENKRKISIVNESKRINSIVLPYLDKMCNMKLFKDEREKLIEIINLKDNRGRLQKSISQLNDYLKLNGSIYKIISNKDYARKLKDGSINHNRNKVYWEITIY